MYNLVSSLLLNRRAWLQQDEYRLLREQWVSCLLLIPLMFLLVFWGPADT